MGFVALYYFAKRAQGAAITLPVVRHVAEIALHVRGLTQRLNCLPLAFSERFFASPCTHRARALADELWKGKELSCEDWISVIKSGLQSTRSAGRRPGEAFQSAAGATPPALVLPFVSLVPDRA